MEDSAELTIGQVAERAGIAPSAVRYYESLGLLPEPRREGGQRRYDADVLDKLAFIGAAKAAGFKLAEIGGLVRGLDGGASLADSLRAASVRRLPEIEAELERMAAVRTWLDAASNCECETLEECALIPTSAPDSDSPTASVAVVSVAGKTCRRA